MMVSALLILALAGSCGLFADAANIATPRDEVIDEKTLSGTVSPLSPVHALRPADISAIYALGMPLSHRDETSAVVNELAGFLSIFNPEVITVNSASLSPKTLLEEAEKLARSPQVSSWKFVLIFVPTDHMCAFSTQVSADIKNTVQEVEAALQILHEQLNQTLVHIVVWSANQEDNSCECMRDENINQRLYKATLLKGLQDSLNDVLENPKWQSENGDFTAVLQPAPLAPESTSESDTTLSEIKEMALQLWTNLLQPSTNKTKVAVGNVPLPTEERPFLRTKLNSPTVRKTETEITTEGRFSFIAPAQRDPGEGSVIPCTDRDPSPTAPTSVHELRPGDIKVVAAVGDSFTAANGAGAKTDDVQLLLNQYRGLSWSIGGDENIASVTTLPNILREFNPLLTGFSKGIGTEESPAAFLNQAVTGARSSDMVRQVRALVDRMKNDVRIDFYNDWKVITMFIGGNDICDFCTDSEISPRDLVDYIQQALDILFSEMPRAFVNLVEVFNMIPLRALHTDETLDCPTWFTSIKCPCIIKPEEGSAELQSIEAFNRDYQRAMRELIDSGRYDTHNNFTVVLQPFFREVVLPVLEDGRPDRSYFALDCLHLSQKSQTLLARALWNNMLEPVGKKTFTQDFLAGNYLKCPSETIPFLRTAANSNYTFPGTPLTTDPIIKWGSNFTCLNIAPSYTVPTSAHKVRPGDIKVVAALGDSLTAAFGAKATSLFWLMTEYRGVSWSIGGDESLEAVTTLPNILKKFNPDIKGVSKGRGKSNKDLNMSISGAKIAGIPAQVRSLIARMKNNPTVDFENDWKLVTLFIGGNDLCQYCNDPDALSPDKYIEHMTTSLDILYKEVPRAIVNVLEILEIEGLRTVKRNVGCTVLQRYVCPCFITVDEDSPELVKQNRVNRELQRRTTELVKGGRYDGREDFTVVLQPFFEQSNVPLKDDGEPDVSFFSVDCFHFSERGHAGMAVSLWNNMLEPVGQKQKYNNFTDISNINCPSEDRPYIFTNRNSVPSVNTTLATDTVA